MPSMEVAEVGSPGKSVTRVSDIHGVEVTVKHESDNGRRANSQLCEAVTTSGSCNASTAVGEEPTERVVRWVRSLP